LHLQGFEGGNERKQVTSLQRDLNTLGYLDVTPTGYYGSLTTAAVKKLQRNYGLKEDGIAGPDTLSLIKRLINERTASRSSGGTTLKEGMSGSSVTALQKDLKALGYLSVDPNGLLWKPYKRSGKETSGKARS